MAEAETTLAGKVNGVFRRLWGNRLLLAAAAAVLLAVAGYLVYTQVLSRPAQTAQLQTVPVQRTNILATVNASGTVSAPNQARLTFKTPGIVKEVYVKVGDAVKQGDPLAALDTTDLQAQVTQAEANVNIARFRLQQLLQPPKPQDIQSLQAAYDSALAKYEAAKAALPTEEQLRAAQANYEAAVAKYQNLLNPPTAGQDLAALQAQISPHFVYNTLNTIAAFIRTEPETARQLLTDFADFLRRTFRRRGEYSPFAQELGYVHQYLTFEKARFGDRLEVVYRVDPEILSTVVPVLVLQPLVENAVRHGISRKLGPGRVVIAAEDRGNECWISVEDDGVGMDAELVQQVLQRPRRNTYGVGLSNVNERLRSIYGPEYGLEIVSRPGEGTRVSFSVPKYKAGVEI